MLKASDSFDRNKSLELFESFAGRIYDKDTAKLLKENWLVLAPWHFQLIEHLKNQGLNNKGKIFQLGLYVKSVEIALFVDFADTFTNTPCFSLLLSYT